MTTKYGRALPCVPRAATVFLALSLRFFGASLASCYVQALAACDEPRRADVVFAAQRATNATALSRVDLFGDPLPDGAVARLGTTRLNHGSSLNSVIFATDGSFLFSLGWDHVIRVWDPITGRENRQISNGVDSLGCLAISPDGKILATGTTDGEGNVIVFDMATGRETGRSDSLKGDAWPIAFAPDGQTIATGDSCSGRVVLWDARSLKELRRVEAHRRVTFVVAFASGGRILVTGGSDAPPQNPDPRTGSVAIFDVATERSSGDFRSRMSTSSSRRSRMTTSTWRSE